MLIVFFFNRRRIDIDDDLIIVRNILHINMSICLLLAQILFVFGIDLIKYEVKPFFLQKNNLFSIYLFLISLLVELVLS